MQNVSRMPIRVYPSAVLPPPPVGHAYLMHPVLGCILVELDTLGPRRAEGVNTTLSWIFGHSP